MVPLITPVAASLSRLAALSYVYANATSALLLGPVVASCVSRPAVSYVPAVLVRVAHPGAMLIGRVVSQIAELVRDPQPRWTPGQVEAARRKILGEGEKVAAER